MDNTVEINLNFNSQILKCDVQIDELNEDFSKFWNIEKINSV